MARRSTLRPAAPELVISGRTTNRNSSVFAGWLERANIHPQELATDLGLTVGYVYSLRSGRATPGAKLRLQIQERTGGEVKFDDWGD